MEALKLNGISTQISVVAAAENYARFAVEPLISSHALPLGNALRRVLVSSIPGAAITRVKIAGVLHEFSTIAGVREDGTQLALNLKGVRLRSYTDRAVTMQLLKQQAGPVFAGDIDAPSTIEIVNPQHYLCTIDDNDTFLEMQLIAERGRGVALADQASGMSLGEIAIDALFNPIVRVNFLVEEAEQSTLEDPYERLILEIWTDGTLKPGDALSYGAQILSQHFSSVAAYNEQPPEPALPAATASSAPAESYDLPIDTLDLSTRTYNSLRRAGITSVGQLLDLDERELYSIRNLGPRSAEEIRVKLKEIGYQSSGGLPPELMAAAEQSDEEAPTSTDEDPDAPAI